MDNSLGINPVKLDLNTFITQAVPATRAVGDPGQSNFTDTLAHAGTSLVQAVEGAEATSIAAMKGEAGAYEVVSAVMQAEQALRMTISVRDKIISAYLEISRMQI